MVVAGDVLYVLWWHMWACAGGGCMCSFPLKSVESAA